MSLRFVLAALLAPACLGAAAAPAIATPSAVTAAPYREQSRLRLTYSRDTTCSPDGTRLQPAGDFNQDGRPDLVASHLGAAYALAQGSDGVFSIWGWANAAPAESAGVGAGDFSGDGRADLVVAGTNKVQVLINNGNGFNPALTTDLGSIGPRAVITDMALADFNRDGKLDIVVVDTDPLNYARYHVLPNNGGIVFQRASVAMLWGNGNGTFSVDAARPRLNTPDFPQRLLADDFNGDTRPELLIASNDRLQLYFNPAAGFASTSTYPPLGITEHTNVYAMLSGRFNNDNGRDLAVAYYQPTATTAGGYFRIRPYRYSTHPQLPFALNGDPLEVPFSYVPAAMAAADENGDGYSDLVVAIEGDRQASVALLRSRGDFTFEPAQIYNGNFNAGAIYSADFTNDSRPDIAVIDCNAGELVVLKHD